MLLLLLAGCATAPHSTAANGPVAVTIGDVRHMCLASGYDSPRGCLMQHPNGRITIYCADGSRDELAECLAHEVRHLVEPAWRH